PEEAERLPRAHVEIDAVDRGEVTEAFDERTSVDQGEIVRHGATLTRTSDMIATGFRADPADRGSKDPERESDRDVRGGPCRSSGGLPLRRGLTCSRTAAYGE